MGTDAVDPCNEFLRRDEDWAEVSVSVPSVAKEPSRAHSGLKVPTVVDGPEDWPGTAGFPFGGACCCPAVHEQREHGAAHPKHISNTTAPYVCHRCHLLSQPSLGDRVLRDVPDVRTQMQRQPAQCPA